MARFRSGRPADKVWSSIPALVTSPTTATTLITLGLGFSSAFTILRCRGMVQAHFDSTAQVGDTMNLTFALGIFATDAVNAGAASISDPQEEPDYPWLWWDQIFLDASQAAGPVSWGPGAHRVELDTKAMRRVKPGQSLIGVIQTTNVAGAPVVDIGFGQTRVLLAS